MIKVTRIQHYNVVIVYILYGHEYPITIHSIFTGWCKLEGYATVVRMACSFRAPQVQHIGMTCYLSFTGLQIAICLQSIDFVLVV